MTPYTRRTRVAMLLAALLPAASLAPAAPAAADGPLQPDKLVILSTTDAKGKTGPCGCQVPKGGFARRAGYTDSLRAEFGQVLVVDAGGFFPETDAERDHAAFQIEGMKRAGVEVAGVGERDLRFGLAFLRGQARTQGLELVAANLVERRSGRPAFAPWTLRKVGGVQVGVFGLITPNADLGPSADSLEVQDPVRTATATVAELRRRGATVVVLLSQLGKIDGEDLLLAVSGIDAAILGRNVPVIARGRLIRSTVANYGGEQAQYLGQTVLTLDARGAMTAGETSTVALGPAVRERADLVALVRAFEAAHPPPAAEAAPAAGPPDGSRP
jgi:2',3'-cyclic-nucleotide 2'-phosphodiesterase (5'-nucleotidase family)